MFYRQCKYDQTISMYRKSLNIKSSFPSYNDANVAISYTNIGFAYGHQYNDDQEVSMQKSMNIGLSTLGHGQSRCCQPA